MPYSGSITYIATRPATRTEDAGWRTLLIVHRYGGVRRAGVKRIAASASV